MKSKLGLGISPALEQKTPNSLLQQIFIGQPLQSNQDYLAAHYKFSALGEF